MAPDVLLDSSDLASAEQSVSAAFDVRPIRGVSLFALLVDASLFPYSNRKSLQFPKISVISN